MDCTNTVNKDTVKADVERLS